MSSLFGNEQAWHAWWRWGFVIYFLIPELVALVSRGTTASQSWRDARATWSPSLSLGLVVATSALGFWLLTVHWVSDIHDARGWHDDLIVALAGAAYGALAWLRWHRSLPGTSPTASSSGPSSTGDSDVLPAHLRPSVHADVGPVPGGEVAEDVRDGEVRGH